MGLIVNRYPSCPHCGGLLSLENDGYEYYLDCCGCAREFDFDMNSRRMTTEELKRRMGITLTMGRDTDMMRML